MHVGSGDGHVAQSRYLELAVEGFVRDRGIGEQSVIDAAGLAAVGGAHRAINGCPDVVILVVRERLLLRTAKRIELVALAAARELVGEKEDAAQLLLIGQLGFAPQVAVVFRIEGREFGRALEGCDGLLHRRVSLFAVVENVAAEQRVERGDVLRLLLQAGDHARLVGHSHLDGVEWGSTGLFFECLCPAIEEEATHGLAAGIDVEFRHEARVGGRRRIAVAERLAVIAQRHRTADTFHHARVGERHVRRMATHA